MTHAEILDLHHLTLERHRQATLELIPRPPQLSLPNPVRHRSCDAVELLRNQCGCAREE